MSGHPAEDQIRLAVQLVLESWSPRYNICLDAMVLAKVCSLNSHTQAAPYVSVVMQRLEGISLSDWALECLEEWTRILRVHFQDPQKGALSTSSMIRSKLDPSGSNTDELASFEGERNDLHWQHVPIARSAFIWCLECLRANLKFEQLAKLLPFVLQLADDHRWEARMDGIAAIKHLLSITSTSILTTMNLHDLFLKSIMTSLSFDQTALKQTAMECLLNGLLPRSKGKHWPDSHSQVMVFCIKEATFGRNSESPSFYLEAIAKLVEIMEIFSVVHLKDILLLLLECTERHEKLDHAVVLNVLEQVMLNCWPRLPGKLDLIERILQSSPLQSHVERIEPLKTRINLIRSLGDCTDKGNRGGTCNEKCTSAVLECRLVPQEKELKSL